MKKPAPKWTEQDVKDIVCNPIYAGVPPFPAILSEEEWIRVAKKAIEVDGVETFLKTMLTRLRATYADVMAEEGR